VLLGQVGRVLVLAAMLERALCFPKALTVVVALAWQDQLDHWGAETLSFSLQHC
jgi:hypothetical protein